jgi:hypothetical protein
MFKVIAEWLKTSKKTKGGGEDERVAPAIEEMRATLAEFVAAQRAELTPDITDDDLPEDYEPPPLSKHQINAAKAKRNNGKFSTIDSRSADPSQLDKLLATARTRAEEKQ